MRHTSEILKELGFNEDAPESTKKAFLKHLEQSANTEKSTLRPPPPSSVSQHPEQISFEFIYQTENVESDSNDQLELVLVAPKTNVKAA